MIKCQCNSPPEIVCGPYAEVWGVWHLKYDCAWDGGGITDRKRELSGTAPTSNLKWDDLVLRKGWEIMLVRFRSRCPWFKPVPYLDCIVWDVVTKSAI
jgi:hypothetical protein